MQNISLKQNKNDADKHSFLIKKNRRKNNTIQHDH